MIKKIKAICDNGDSVTFSKVHGLYRMQLNLKDEGIFVEGEKLEELPIKLERENLKPFIKVEI